MYVENVYKADAYGLTRVYTEYRKELKMKVRRVCKRCGKAFIYADPGKGKTLREKLRAYEIRNTCDPCIEAKAREQYEGWQRRNAEYTKRHTKAYRDQKMKDSIKKRGIIRRVEE